MIYFKYSLLVIIAIVCIYVFSRIQAIAWLHTLEKFLNNKYNNTLKTK